MLNLVRAVVAVKARSIENRGETDYGETKCWARVCWCSCEVGAAQQSEVKNALERWLELLGSVTEPSERVRAWWQSGMLQPGGVKMSSVVSSRRRRGEEVVALSGVLQIGRAAVVLPVVPPGRRE